MITSNQEVIDSYQTLQQVENTLWGQVMFGSAKFRQAHNILDVRALGVADKMSALKKKYFEMVKDQIQYEEIPSKKEGGTPTKKAKMNGELTMEEFNKEMETLLLTKIEL